MFHPAIDSRYFDIFRVKTWKLRHYMLQYIMPCHTLTVYLFKLKAHTSDIWPFLEEVVSSYEWREIKYPLYGEKLKDYLVCMLSASETQN